MKVSVWDTYVKRGDQKIMHFDILVPDDMISEKTIFAFGQEYLSSKIFKTGALSAKECKYCHVEQASDEVIKSINEKGYYILEMENCI